MADVLSRPPDGLSSPGVAPATISPSVSALSASPAPLSPDQLAASQSQNQAEMDKYFIDGCSLSPTWIPIPGAAGRLLCDTSLTSVPPRPIVPSCLVLRLHDGVHGLHNPGGNATLRDVRRRYILYPRSLVTQDHRWSCSRCLIIVSPLSTSIWLDHYRPSEGFSFLLSISIFLGGSKPFPSPPSPPRPAQRPSSALGCPVRSAGIHRHR